MPSLMIAVLALAADPLLKPEAIELKTDTGTLYATIDLPAGKGPWTAVLIHAGSGPTDRDGNSGLTTNNALKFLGEALAAAGYAAVRIDKRGVAASAKAFKKEEELSLQTYADDAIAWAEKLRKDERFNRIAFIGHSEGSLIGAMAAPKAKFAAFVSLCGPGRKLADVLREQLKQNAPTIAESSEPILKALEAGKVYDGEIPKDLKALFRPSVQPFLISMLARDPVKDMAAVECPLLVVSGSTDIQVKEADAKLLAECRKGVTAVRIDKMNHVLKEIESTNQFLQSFTYTDGKKALHPKLAGSIVDFLKASAKK